ncbi:hypothetical protein O6H91_11G027300 [Diphasiastrum complanatum]|uniref:Uncharacterized protein n=1 Tax=Diphasiastrum complanatum TaxID=34168 RepID=A0ACC2C7C8_DIPCM|nr:hypothetical protein O6H91_11G027300 [Diphasiastrum complanatum]
MEMAQALMQALLGCVAIALVLLGSCPGAYGIRFVIDRKECFYHNVPYAGDTVYVSFVLVKSDNTWIFERAGVDLVVESVDGEHKQVYDVRHKAEEKFAFMAGNGGLYKFCFINHSPVHETIAFDVHVGHIPSHEEHLKDDHFDPLMTQIARLEEALYTVSFEQHWLQAQTERQILLNKSMSWRVVYKAVFESVALICSSLIQVYLLRRLFEKKLGNTRV